MDGTKKCLNMKNASNVFEKELKKYVDPFIIAVDSALSEKSVKEKVFIGKGNFKIGSSLGKGIECKPHIYVKGIVGNVGKSFNENKIILQNVKKEFVISIADLVTDKICNIVDEIKIV